MMAGWSVAATGFKCESAQINPRNVTAEVCSIGDRVIMELEWDFNIDRAGPSDEGAVSSGKLHLL